MAGGSARSRRARWRWCWRRGSAGKSPISPAPRSRFRRCSPAWSSASPSAIASRRKRRGIGEALGAVYRPFVEFFQRQGAFLVLLFILLHKIGDTLANLTLRLLLDDLGFSNDEIAIYDVGVGFWAYLIGIFVGGMLYSKLGMKRSVLISLVLMGVSNFSFAAAGAGRAHAIRAWPATIGVREFRQRHRRRDRRRLFLGAVRPALHRLAICADLGGGEHRRAVPHRHHARARWSRAWAM